MLNGMPDEIGNAFNALQESMNRLASMTEIGDSGEIASEAFCVLDAWKSFVSTLGIEALS